MSNVVEVLEWPSLLETLKISMPSEIRMLTCECRNKWGWRGRRLCLFENFASQLVGASGCMGPPFYAVKTYPDGAIPSLMKIVACSTFHCLRRSITDCETETYRFSLFSMSCWSLRSSMYRPGSHIGTACYYSNKRIPILILWSPLPRPLWQSSTGYKSAA